jgi:hypothetical protein
VSAWAELVLLAPAGLLALATLAIPILIHLFSRSKGKRVLIGHLDLIRLARRQRVTEMRLSQWLLLAVRLALFSLAALMLAQLAQQGLATIRNDTAYVTPGWLQQSDEAVFKEVLTANPGGVFLLAPGFEALDEMPDLSGAWLATGELQKTWPLLAERLSTVSHGGRISVHATGLVSELGDNLAPLPAALDWHLLERPTASASLPQPVVLVVHDAAHRDQAALVSTALEALQRHRLPGLVWTVSESQTLETVPEGTDWLIWLADDPLNLPFTGLPPETVLEHPQVGTGADFPETLLDALLGEQRITSGFAGSTTGPERLERAVMDRTDLRLLPNRPLHIWLAALMILLWVLERWLCERRRFSNG